MHRDRRPFGRRSVCKAGARAPALPSPADPAGPRRSCSPPERILSGFLFLFGLIHLQIRRLKAGIQITVRLNIDRHNADDLFNLADTLIAKFGGDKLFTVYSHSLFDTGTSETAVSHTDAQRRELFETRLRLQEKLRAGKIDVCHKLPDKLKLHRCMADSDTNILVLPDGHLGKCEHYTDSHWFGDLDSSERDGTVLEDFKRLREEIEACKDCPFYPDCFRLMLCDEAVHCYPEEREEKLQETRQSLLSFYQKRKDEVSD